MTKTKSNRIFLAIVTLAMALAGTGLTIANNWKNELQQAAIAITLAACFTAAETSFLWGHKRFETSTRLWRKVVLTCALVALVGSMAYAVSEELKLALHKVSNRSLADNSAVIVASADKRNQRVLGKNALESLVKDKIQIEHFPFVICYLVTGLASIAILAVTERAKPRTLGKGNVLPKSPELQKRVQEIGFAANTAKAYAVDGGYAVYVDGKYRKFLKEEK